MSGIIFKKNIKWCFR